MTLTWNKNRIILPDGKRLIVREKAIVYDDDGNELFTRFTVVVAPKPSKPSRHRKKK